MALQQREMAVAPPGSAAEAEVVNVASSSESARMETEDIEVISSGSEADGHTAVSVVPPAARHDLMEFFSPPRLTSMGRVHYGLVGSVAVDLMTGFDLSTAEGRDAAHQLWLLHNPRVLLLCPPCTMYSPLNRFFNLGKMQAEERARRQELSDLLRRSP